MEVVVLHDVTGHLAELAEVTLAPVHQDAAHHVADPGEGNEGVGMDVIGHW